jgi:hypothetical protein
MKDVLIIAGITDDMLKVNANINIHDCNSEESVAHRPWNKSKMWLPQIGNDGTTIDSEQVKKMKNSPEYLASIAQIQFYDD